MTTEEKKAKEVQGLSGYISNVAKSVATFAKLDVQKTTQLWTSIRESANGILKIADSSLKGQS